MDKKKLLTASLASVAVLGLAFATSQLSVVKAEEETTAQNEFLANFDKALDETVKALEEDAKNNPESADQIKETIANLKAEAAKNRAEFEKGFKNGVTAEAAEKEVEKAAKAEEAAEEAEAQEEAAAQKEFLANFDKALEDAIAELKKADTQKDPELEKQVQDAITKLKEEAAKQKKEIEDGFKNGLTVEEAEKAIDDANKKAEEEAKAEAEEKAAQDEFLANYDKALEEAVKELEKAETNSPEEVKAKADTIAALKAASEQTRSAIVEGFKKGMTVEEAEVFIDELNKKAAEEDKEAQTNNRVESSNGQEAPINEVSEFDLSTLKGGVAESKGNQNSRVPEKLPATPASQPGQEPAATPAESPAPAQAETATPAVAGTSQDNTYQAPAAKAEDKKELPNTGGKDNAAIASLGFLGLLLGALPFVKRKN